MRKYLIKLASTVAVASAFVAAPAMAQATRTWISGVGDDVNPCSRTAPCKTFAGAISKTAAGGEINCLDSGGFGAVTITKAITLRCIGVEGGVLVSGTNGININAGVNDRVVLIGLDIEGLSNGTSINGVNVLQAGYVTIQDCTIHGFNGSGSNGVLINSASPVTVEIDRSTLSSNTVGAQALSATGGGHLIIHDSSLIDNASVGIRLAGTGNDAIILRNSVTGSTNSLFIKAGNSVVSYGENLLSSGSPPTSTSPLQ